MSTTVQYVIKTIPVKPSENLSFQLQATCALNTSQFHVDQDQ